MRSFNCPNCNATITLENNNKDFAFCQYCGSKIILDDYRSTYRIVDEAKIKQAETDQLVSLRKMELAEKKRVANEKNRSLKIKISLILAALGILMIILGVLAGEASGDPDSRMYMISVMGLFPLCGAVFVWLEKDDDTNLSETVKVPNAVTDFKKKNFEAIKAIFESAGFNNVKCIPLNDLTVGVLKKPGLVESITINGQEVLSGGKQFSPDASVIISYHSFTKR